VSRPVIISQPKKRPANGKRPVKSTRPLEDQGPGDTDPREGFVLGGDAKPGAPRVSRDKRILYSLMQATAKNPRMQSMGTKQAHIRKAENKRAKAAEKLLKSMLASSGKKK